MPGNTVGRLSGVSSRIEIDPSRWTDSKTYDKWLAQIYPDLEMQMRNHAPERHEHDTRATDNSLRWNPRRIRGRFIAGEGSTDWNRENIWPTRAGGENRFDFNLQFAYERSETFRRLFHEADRNLQYPHLRELADPDSLREATTVPAEITFPGGRVISLRITPQLPDTATYISQWGTQVLDWPRSCIREIIGAMTGLPDEGENFHPRGAVVEYTNIVLKEMGHDGPACSEYVPQWARGHQVHTGHLGLHLVRCGPDETTLADVALIRAHFPEIEPGSMAAQGRDARQASNVDTPESDAQQNEADGNPFATYPRIDAFEKDPRRDSTFVFPPERGAEKHERYPQANTFKANSRRYNPMALPPDFVFSPERALMKRKGCKSVFLAVLHVFSLAADAFNPKGEAPPGPRRLPPLPTATPKPASSSGRPLFEQPPDVLSEGLMAQLAARIGSYGGSVLQGLSSLARADMGRRFMLFPGSDAQPLDAGVGRNPDADEDAKRAKRDGNAPVNPRLHGESQNDEPPLGKAGFATATTVSTDNRPKLINWWNQLYMEGGRPLAASVNASKKAEFEENALLDLAGNKTEEIINALRVFGNRVLDPVAYIEGKIKGAVVAYGGDPSAINGNTTIPVSIKAALDNAFSLHLQADYQIKGSHTLGNFTLTEIVTREYLRELGHYYALKIDWPKGFPRGLGQHFEDFDIQSAYTHEIEAFSRTSNVEASITLLFGFLAHGNAVKYLQANQGNRTPALLANREAVEQYLNGTRKAATLAWEGHDLVNTVFILSHEAPDRAPVQSIRPMPFREQARGVIYFTDDQQWYDVRINEVGFEIMGGSGGSINLHKYIKSHLSLHEQLQYDDDLNPHSNWRTNLPYCLSYERVDNIGHALYQIFLATLVSNMDTMVKSNSERLTENALCFLETFGTLLSIALIPVGATGVPIVSHSVTGLLIGTVSSVTPNAVLAGLADRPDDADAFVANAVTGALFEAGGLFAPTLLKKLGQGAVGMAGKIRARVKHVIDKARAPLNDGSGLGAARIKANAVARVAGTGVRTGMEVASEIGAVGTTLVKQRLRPAPIVRLEDLED